METLNTRGKRSALVRGRVRRSGNWTYPTSSFLLVTGERAVLRTDPASRWTHKQWLSVDILIYSWLKMTECIVRIWNRRYCNPKRSSLPSSLKSVPAQEHRFQMVLDGILYSKTPSETSSLGRMPLGGKTTFSHLSFCKTNKQKILSQHAFSQLNYTNTINKSG